jgi:hypothetical protein
MKPLQITLFIMASVIFLTQCGRDVHQLVWGAEPSVLDQFSPARVKARSEKDTAALVADYRSTDAEIRNLEKSKNYQEAQDIRQQNEELYGKREALRGEISEREAKGHEIRDVWIFAGYGVALILVGLALYRRGSVWPGMAAVIAGFTIFEYWASPSFFGGAGREFHALLVSKTVLTFIALLSLYIACKVMKVGSRTANC